MVVSKLSLKPSVAISILLFLAQSLSLQVTSFTSRHLLSKNASRSVTRNGKSLLNMAEQRYGKGAEIYPPTNSDRIIKLEDSFPNGKIPYIALSTMSSSEQIPVTNEDDTEATARIPKSTGTDMNTRSKMQSAISLILRSAARSEIKKLFSKSESNKSRHYDPVVDLLMGGPIDKTPSLIALILLFMGLVPPTQVLCFVFLSGYTFVLGIIGASSKNSDLSMENNDVSKMNSRNIHPILPSLPPQGHVPSLISNPLGNALTNSIIYRTWLKCGIWIGVLSPLAAIGWYRFFGTDANVAKMVAKPVFLLCCQATSEAVARRLLAPLPLRIIIPLLYSSFRMAPLYEWAMTGTTIGYIGRLLAVTNLVYWGANLFGFLIPIASMRYLRSFFFCVEAAEVTMRDGSDGRSVGLLP